MRRYYFVYVIPQDGEIDIRCPRGGVTVCARGTWAAFVQARQTALSRFPVRPWECLHVAEVTRPLEKHQVRILELAKRKHDNAFRLSLMR